jgi:Protein of unknown function (DUF3142)
MRSLDFLLPLIAALGMSGCADSLQSQPPAKWTTGFWFWNGSSTQNASPVGTLDVLFAQTGTIFQSTLGNVGTRSWSVVDGYLPEELPPAREYWLVFRFDHQGVPDLKAAPVLGATVFRLRESARKRHLNVVGVQLDIDSPTRALPQYAEFLRSVRKNIPPEFAISITALLDWFRPGTSIDQVIQETDEFVPQFYDVSQPDGYDKEEGIATKFEAAAWAPQFNRFRKRFRIGISTFGRARFVPKENPSPSGNRVLWFRDPTPMDFATTSAFNLTTTRSEANELILSYRATREIHFDYRSFQPGDTMQFILSTPDAIRAAIESARRMGSYCAGVVFFRWPSGNEILAMQPDEVMAAAGLLPEGQKKPVEIHVVNGSCAAVSCVDLYLVNRSAFGPSPHRYRIRSSLDLQYFLPEQNFPVRMTAPSNLIVSLPAYCARGNMYLGRAVSDTRADFKVEEEQ